LVLKKSFQVWISQGMTALIHKLINKTRRTLAARFRPVHRVSDRQLASDEASLYERWIATHEPGPADLEVQSQTRLDYEPKISVGVPVFHTPLLSLLPMIESVLKQTYRHWELCIADGGTDSLVRAVLEHYRSMDSRIRVEFLQENKGIAGNSNAALALST